MKIDDIVYGSFEISEPVLEELISSKSVQRLKGVGQFGLPDEFLDVPSFTRYEHSVGVMLLLRKLGADIEEQIAGLLHDVSHTAFSHTIELLLGNPGLDTYQDENHKSVILNSELPELLSRYRFDFNRVADIKNYSLLEQEIPDLCADRVDYGLREFHCWANPEAVKLCLNNLAVYEGKIIFESEDAADVFGRNFSKCNAGNWANPHNIIKNYFFCSSLKTALDEKIISLADFYETDEFVLEKLKSAKNPVIDELLELLSKNIPFETVGENPQLILKKKFRYVDPSYRNCNGVYRLSETNNNYREFLEEQKRLHAKSCNVNILVPHLTSYHFLPK